MRRPALFTTVRSEGGMLPADLLARVATGDSTLEAIGAEAYHLALGERLGEAISRSWNRLVGAWASWVDAVAQLPPTDRTATELTRKRWSLAGNVFTRGPERYLPLYEAKMLHHFDHRWATYDGLTDRDLNSAEKADPTVVALPAVWVPFTEMTRRRTIGFEWEPALRGTTNTTNERTIIASALSFVAAGNSAPILKRSLRQRYLLWPSSRPLRWIL